MVILEKDISVVVSVRNVERFIAKCLSSILNQTYSHFELVILDSLSTDGTVQEIKKFNDNRIRFYEINNKLGLTEARNESIKFAAGKYLFFTDGDCIVAKDWLMEGINSFRNNPDCIAVEGKTYYVSEDYKPTRSDDIVENLNGGLYHTCNIAYKKSVFQKVGFFDERFNYHEDRDFAYRAAKLGKIIFNSKMVVYHQKKTIKPKDFIKTGKRLKNRVLLYKKYGENPLFMGRVAYPLNLATLLFPPLVFASFLRNRYRSKADFDLFPFIYFQILYERLSLWEICARERVLLI